MRRTLLVTLLAATFVSFLAGTAHADQPAGPWGSEPWESWCTEQVSRGVYPPECSAQWHPAPAETSHPAPVHPAPPVRKQAPVRRAELIPPRVWLADTGPTDSLPWIAAAGVWFLLVGAVLVRASIRRQVVSL